MTDSKPPTNTQRKLALFLDIDDVLNNQKHGTELAKTGRYHVYPSPERRAACPGLLPYQSFDPRSIADFNTLLRKLSEMDIAVDIVLSSNWRFMMPLAAVCEVMRTEGLEQTPCAVTPKDIPLDCWTLGRPPPRFLQTLPRSAEIATWLRQAFAEGRAYDYVVVVDDLTSANLADEPLMRTEHGGPEDKIAGVHFAHCLRPNMREVDNEANSERFGFTSKQVDDILHFIRGK